MACSSRNSSCILTASFLSTTTLAPATNSSLYANESCLAVEQHAKLRIVTDKKKEQVKGEEEKEEVVVGEKSDRKVGGEEGKRQMQVDYNEAQENVRMSVLVDPERSLDDDLSASRNSSSSPAHQQLAADYSAPGECCGASDNNEANQQHQLQVEQGEGGGQEDEEMERRLFGLSLSDEMKKQLRKQRFKLFSRAHLKKRKRKRHPPGSGTLAPSSGDSPSRIKTSERLKSALTRQGTTTVNYADLAQDTWLQEMRTSFHSINKPPVSAPLMQKLFAVDKLSPSSSNSHLVGHHMLTDHQMLPGDHPRLFVPPSLDNSNTADLLNNWAAGDPTGARSALVKHVQSKMIPIEIIGLDPQVTKSILQADSPLDENTGNFASDSSMGNPTLASAFPPPLRPPKTSILHVHHFHTSRPLLGQTTLPVGNGVALESRPNQQAGRPLNLRQAFLNERGEIVYFDPTGGGLSKTEPHLMAESLESPLDLSTVSAVDVPPNKLSYPSNQGGAMVQYVPAGSQLSQQATLFNKQETPAKQRFFVTTDGQTVSVMGSSDGYQQQQVNLDEQLQQQFSAQPQDSADNKMLMVAYRPQQSANNNSNHSLDDALVNKYNEGQESKASMVSASGLVLRPLSGLLQSVVAHPVVRNSPDLSHLPFAASMSQFNGSNRGKQHLPSNTPNSPIVPSNAQRQQHHPEPDLIIKGPPPVDSQSFWLGATSELQHPSYNSALPVSTFKNHSHLLHPNVSELNSHRNLPAPLINGRATTNGTLTAPSQDFLRKLLKGLQMHKDTGQNLTLAPPHQLAALKSASGQSKHLIRDINQPPTSTQSTGKPSDSSQPPLRVRNQLQLGSMNEAALRDFSDSGGSDGEDLGNITLAFISVVSLLTLILIAASMLYRHRRRSTMSRCASLPARSRLNLTHRTKRFMRSNFVRPDQGITPIKRVDLDSNCSSPADKLGPPPPPSVQQNHISSIEARRTPAPVASAKPISGDRCGSTKPTGAPAQILSTFNGIQPASNTTTTNPDIKTLNTRLQKSTYLKSQISGADCISQLMSCTSGHKKQPTSNGRTIHKSGNSSDTVCYISNSNSNDNCRQHTDCKMFVDGKQCSMESQKSHSFKNLSSNCDVSINPHHNYSFARKSGSMDRNSINFKHYNINRMSTINSESDNNLHSSKFSDSESSQNR